MATKIQGGSSTAGLANVTSDFKLEVRQGNAYELNGIYTPDQVGSVRMLGIVDDGLVTGEAKLLPPYIDRYYRTYISSANLLDSEQFNYTAQNTGKHTYANTTMTNTWSAAGLLTNATSITTITTGTSFGTYAMFSMIGNTNLDCEANLSFSAQPQTNTIIDFGFFQRGAANPYAPTDGAYFRLNSSGIFCVTNSNGTEVTSGAAVDFTNITGATSYEENRKYRFYIAITVKGVEFWINDILVYYQTTSIGLGQPFMSQAIPFSLRHAITGGAAGGIMQCNLNNYSIINAGVEYSDNLGNATARVVGSFQGLSGGTMGSLASYANSANPTAAVPTNTTSTVLTALGGQGWETDTLAVTTDGIIMSFQVPAGTANVQGKRLKVVGLKIYSFIQTALTGGGYNAQFSLCWGHTAVSLATAEAATTKSPRRIALGSYSVAAAAAALTQLPIIEIDLEHAPIYVNPSEFIAIAKKKIGTAPSAGVVAYTFTPIYTWE